MSFLANIHKQTITTVGSWSISEVKILFTEEHHQECENKTLRQCNEELLQPNSEKS